MKWLPMPKRVIIILGVLIVMLLFIAFFTATRAVDETKQLIMEEFNNQQLVLARHVASFLTTSINTLREELSVLNLSATVQYLDMISLKQRMQGSLQLIKNKGVLEVRRIDAKGEKVYILDTNDNFYIKKPSKEDFDVFKWAQRKENKGKIYISPIYKGVFNYKKELIMYLAQPTYGISVNEAFPIASHKFEGCLLFILDTSRLIENVVSQVKSGKTGYTWVIDERGTYLYHPKTDHIGQDAFKARLQRGEETGVKVSFLELDTIQKEKMQRGFEGKGEYISNWHLGVIKKMRKLLAYTPVWLREEGSPPFWSVAVCAPMVEVESRIANVYREHLFFQGLLLVAIVLVFVGGILVERRYSVHLQKEVENKTRELKTSQEKYKMLVENANDLIYLMDCEGKIISINQYGSWLIKRNNPAADDCIGKDIFCCIHPLDENFSLQIIRQACSTSGLSFEHEVDIGGKGYWLSTNLIPIKKEDGGIAILGISRDITQQKEMSKQLFNTEKLASLGILSAGVAHEINNPIAIILGFSELLTEDGGLSSEEMQQALERIKGEAERCKKIVESLLIFSRFKEYSEEIIDINTTLEKVIEIVKNNLLINKINLEKYLAPDLPKAKVDARQIQQVFLNIINNAIHAMPHGGVLTVITKTNPTLGMIEILIKDSGTGIKPQHRRKIFDPFFSTKEVGKGTGLGLTVSYGIVATYGGSIDFKTKTIEEDPKDHGSTFIIRLPIYNPKKEG